MKKTVKTIIFAQVTAILMATSLANSAERELPLRGSLRGVESYEQQFPTLLVVGGGVGTATHLGRVTAVWEVEVNLETVVGVGSGQFLAANGDSIFFTFGGQATPVEPPNKFSVVENASITGGTGRFAGATGNFTMQRSVDLGTGDGAGSFEGSILIPTGK